WLIVVGAVLIQLCLGAIYAWSVFRIPLQQSIADGGLGLTPSQATLPFSLVLIFFAIATIIGGRWQDKAGPRLVATVGGIILGSGLIIAALSRMFLWLTIGYGFISGIGIGFTYVCPVATGIKWFPDKRGMITGLSVAGFGAGALIVAPLARTLIGSVGVFSTLAIMGIVFLVVIVLSAQILRNPPQGWKPEGWIQPEKTESTGRDFGPIEMLSSMSFYLVWLTYFIGCLAGLMIIAQTSPIGEEVVGLSPRVAAIAVGTLAVFNALGRIFWGRLSDSLGRKKTLFLMLIINGAAILLYYIPRGYGRFLRYKKYRYKLRIGFHSLRSRRTSRFAFRTESTGDNKKLLYGIYGNRHTLLNRRGDRYSQQTSGYKTKADLGFFNI
ncbi:MAG: OFA family MFS transporter, partial [candidate division WOR-3 bacterium]